MNKFYLPLATILLLCLAPMPFGYFQLVRFLATLAFGVMAYRFYRDRKEVLTYTFGVLALLFQPFYKIALGRTIWNVVDLVVAIGLIILFLCERKNGYGRKRPNPVMPEQPIQVEPVEDNRIEFSLQGKLAPKELIYVASEEDKALTDLFESRPEVFEGWGEMIGFHIIYLPLLMKRLANKEVIRYRAPYLNDAELNKTTIAPKTEIHLQGKNDFLLQYLEHPQDKGRLNHGFIRTEDIRRGSDGKDKAINRFYPLSSKDVEPLADQLHRIGKQISVERSLQNRLLEKKMGSKPPYNGADENFNSQIGKEDINDLIEEVRERVAKLRQRGISQYILEQLIHPDDRLSRLVITKDYRLLLPDYNDMEIKMEPLVKAVYLLFLKHPEGILFKHLSDYREELTRIYTKLKPKGMNDKAIQSIEDVTNPLLNSINEKCARIRGAFVGQFDNQMARYYYIDGLRGEVKKIALPRKLVIWE